MSIEYTVELVERPVVRDFIEKHHYSHNINGLMSSYCFAMYDQDNHMVGAMIYGKLGMANAWKKYGDSIDEVMELRRLVLVDDTPKNSESFFIGRTLRWLKANTPVTTIVSYADPNYGHSGVIYRATNFEHVGMTAPGKVIMTTTSTIIDSWAEAARPILMDVARHGTTITYQELWDNIQATTTDTPAGLWRSHIGTILGTVAELNRHNEEPLMVSLVVLKATGEVSEGYGYGVNVRYGYTPANQAAHATAERIKLYNWMAPTAVR